MLILCWIVWLLACAPGLGLRVQCAGVSGELFKFSTDSMEWTDLSATGVVQGTIPSARASHFMTAVGKDIYLLGGFPPPHGEEEGGRRRRQDGGIGGCWAGMRSRRQAGRQLV